MATLSITVQAHSYPTANAGSAQNITLPTNSLTLIGSGTPSDGATIVSYAWTQTAGPLCTIANPSSATTTVTDMNVAGNYTFLLTITDSDGLSATSSVTEVLTGYPSYVGGTLTVDLYDPNGNYSMFIEAGSIGDATVEDHIVHTGLNFNPTSGTPATASQCWLLASDVMSFSGQTGFRFEANIARLKTYYPSATNLIFKINGRSTTTNFAGAYVLHGADNGQMIMNGTTGSYIPGVTTSDTIGITPYSGASVGTGADGTYSLSMPVVMEFQYNISTNTLTRTI